MKKIVIILIVILPVKGKIMKKTTKMKVMMNLMINGLAKMMPFILNMAKDVIEGELPMWIIVLW